jgi:hypothetical protein
MEKRDVFGYDCHYSISYGDCRRLEASSDLWFFHEITVNR